MNQGSSLRGNTGLSQTGGALCADPEHVYNVVGLGETVCRGRAFGPFLDGIRLNFNGCAAISADEVVVVAARLVCPIPALSVRRLENVRFIAVHEVGERPVHRREAHLLALVTEALVQLLCRDEATGIHESLTHGIPLPGASFHYAHTDPFRPIARRA